LSEDHSLSLDEEKRGKQEKREGKTILLRVDKEDGGEI